MKHFITFVLLLVFTLPAFAQGEPEAVPTYTLFGINATIAMIVTAVVALGVAFIVGRQQGNIAGKLTEALIEITSDKQRNDELRVRIERLPEEHRRAIQQLIDVADPLTRLTATDLDDRVVAWLRSISSPVVIPDDGIHG